MRACSVGRRESEADPSADPDDAVIYASANRVRRAPAIARFPSGTVATEADYQPSSSSSILSSKPEISAT
jgi:hypothetical protein